MKLIYKFTPLLSLCLFVLTTGSLNAQDPSFFEVSSVDLTSVDRGSVAWGDYNNDGHMDILLTGQDSDFTPVAKVYENQGGGAFDEASTINLVGVKLSSVDWGDYNGSGYLDILISGEDSEGNKITTIYENDGNGDFEEVTGLGLDRVDLSSVSWGDYTNNGLLDILYTGRDSNRNRIARVYENDGSGGFEEATSIELTGVQWGSVAWGDYNNDGYIDILLAGSYSGLETTTVIYENDGAGGFEEVTSIELTGVHSSSSSWGDYNNDGYLDILLTGRDSDDNEVAIVYENDGSGGFEEVVDLDLAGVFNNGTSSDPASWGDYNGDGRLDILLSGQNTDGNRIAKVYENDGNGGFTEVTDANLTGVYESSVAWGDYNGNGRLDILLTGENAEFDFITKIYENNETFDPVSLPQPVTSGLNVEGSELVLNWEPVTVWSDERDNSLTYNVYIRNDEGQFHTPPMANTETGFRQKPAHGNSFHNTFYRWDPEPGLYHWGVQTVGTDFRGSPFSEEQTFGWHIQPIAETDAATEVTATSATVPAGILAAGLSTEADIRFGTNTDNLDQDELLASGVDHLQKETYSTTLEELQPDTRYFFTVMAENSEGRVFGDTLSFRTAALELNEPELAAPANEGTVTDEEVVLEWNAVDEAGTYTIQVADNHLFQDPLLEVSEIEITQYLLRDLEADQTYYWRVRAEASGVTGPWSDARSFTTSQETSADDRAGIPGELKLGQNYPNPFNPSTTIRYQLPEAGHTTLKIFDLSGRRVSTLVNETKEAGYHQVQLDGSDLSSGTYLYRLEVGDFTDTRQMTLIK